MDHTLSFCLLVVFCAILTDPLNGDVSFTSTSFGSEATYSCNNGYMLVGSAMRSCDANAVWTPAKPICERKSHDVSRVTEFGHLKPW